MTCNKTFKSKYDLNRHNNKKYKCTYDDAQLKNITDKNIYIEIIKQKNTLLTQMENEIKLIKNEIKLKDEIIKLNRCNTNIENTTNTNKGTINNTTNNNINITLPFGKEVDKITDAEYNDVFKRCYACIAYYVRLKHFSNDNPENHNVFISNMRDQYIQIFENDAWKIDDKEYTLQQLYDVNIEILKNKFNDMKQNDTLTDISIQKFDKFIDAVEYDNENMDNAKKAMQDEIINNIKNDLKKVLYNGRSVVKKSKNNKHMTKTKS